MPLPSPRRPISDRRPPLLCCADLAGPRVLRPPPRRRDRSRASSTPSAYANRSTTSRVKSGRGDAQPASASRQVGSHRSPCLLVSSSVSRASLRGPTSRPPPRLPMNRVPVPTASHSGRGSELLRSERHLGSGGGREEPGHIGGQYADEDRHGHDEATSVSLEAQLFHGLLRK